MANIKEESWALSSADTNAIPAGNRGDSVVGKWCDIWKYQVPTGQAHVLKASHRFSARMCTAPSTPIAATGQMRIVIRDQSEQDEKQIYGPALYVVSSEFQDARKIATLGLRSDLPIEERFFIVIQVFYAAEPVLEADSYFKLETTRIRSTI